MSVIVKGMKMPIGCDGWGTSCPLLQWGLGDVYCRITHRRFDSIEDCYKYAKERPADCPLIEVPPHGNLIDRDALIKYLESEVQTTGVNVTKEYLRFAPTIIEEER